MLTCDLLVVGAGSIGLACVYSAAKRGLDVIGIDQFSVPHAEGSHGGTHRLIRKAYFEHPSYVPLLEESYLGWKELEKRSNRQLYFPTGILYSGLPKSELLLGISKSATLHDIKINACNSSEVKKEFPAFTFNSKHIQLFEPDAGYLVIKETFSVLKDEITKHNAKLFEGETIINWVFRNSEFLITTNKRQIISKYLIVSGGSWMGTLVKELKSSLKVTRQLLVWGQPKNLKKYNPENFPCWIIEEENGAGIYYGFTYGEFGPKATGVKLGYHAPGEPVESLNDKQQFPTHQFQKLQSFIKSHIPELRINKINTETCLYTYSPDQHFIIDVLPNATGGAFIAGLSGHGYKFLPALGEILVELATYGKSTRNIDLFRVDRFS